jgi:hypothetical protein
VPLTACYLLSSRLQPLVSIVCVTVASLLTWCFVLGYQGPGIQTTGSKLFTTLFMLLGILFVFTYVNGAVGFIGRSIKHYILPLVKLQDSILGFVAVCIILLLCVIGVGTLVIVYNENCDFVTALYFVVYTATVRAVTASVSLRLRVFTSCLTLL